MDYLSTKLGTDYVKVVYLKQTDDAEDADDTASSFEEFKERSASELRFDVMPYRGFFQEIDIGDLPSLRDALSHHKFRSVEPYSQCTVKVVFPLGKENSEFRNLLERCVSSKEERGKAVVEFRERYKELSA